MPTFIYRTYPASLFVLIFTFVLSLPDLRAQSTFSVDAYREFLERNNDLTSSGLLNMYHAGGFHPGASTDFGAARFGDSIQDRFQLTEYERELINRNGFMVSERLSYPSFGDALLDIYRADLPVFVSTDAILHALHMSYDEILKDVEEGLIVPRLTMILTAARERLPHLADRYPSEPRMQRSLDDVDVYLTVALRLLTGKGSALRAGNQKMVDSLLLLIEAERPTEIELFSDSSFARPFDFSQFTVRGHYTDSYTLGRYFQAMIWLGRTEFYLTAPKATPTKVHPYDLTRQAIDALLLANLLDEADVRSDWREIDDALRFLIGESDNVTPDNLFDLSSRASISDPAELLDDEVAERFRTTLVNQPYAAQKILSQILFRDPYNPNSVEPASAFMLFGQRFIIDSYVFHNVTYDRLSEKRMLPSSLDVLFALGNNAAAQLLQSELDAYKYAPHLASIRYLIDSYDDEFWNSTFYNSWLGSLRALNPPSPEDRAELPRFMRSGAWWQQKMNTQLAAWTQIRHDNLLYAKQSYSTGVVTCSYPHSLVEPFPEFYAAVADLGERAGERFESMKDRFVSSYRAGLIIDYFNRLGETCRTLETIARKQLAEETLTEDETVFLRSMMQEWKSNTGCGGYITDYNGWYPYLFYPLETSSKAVVQKDYVIADVHTSPTNKDGDLVGWVKHIGTGPINLAVVTCDGPNGDVYAYVGPVMSYFEHTTVNFKRMTDEGWEEMYETNPLSRPFWTNVFLAGTDGTTNGTYESLVLGIENQIDRQAVRSVSEIAVRQTGPNPFSDETVLELNVDPSLVGRRVRAAIYDASGAVVAELLNGRMSPGLYVLRWNGTDQTGTELPSGAYFYRVSAGETSAEGSLILAR